MGKIFFITATTAVWSGMLQYLLYDPQSFHISLAVAVYCAASVGAIIGGVIACLTMGGE